MYSSGDDGLVYNGSCGANAPLSTVAGGILFMVCGQTLSLSMEGAPAASYSWHAMEM